MISKKLFLATALCFFTMACSTQSKQAGVSQEASSLSHSVRSAANEKPISYNDLFNPKATSEEVTGLRNFRVVIPGVLYRGGNSGGGNLPLGNSGFLSLSKRNFSSATYMYTAAYKTPEDKKKINTQGVQYSTAEPTVTNPNAPSTRDFLTKVKDIIENKKGAMYVHCWNGWHASGLMASIALMQFCDFTPEKAQDYWNANVPPRDIGKVRRMLKFQVIDDLRISSEDKARICPR